MSGDPFYEQILAGLKGPLDRYLFQDCMTDLLRDTFPSLVPVRGGKDSGMDGAIADGKGEPYPLVVTTAKDVERNLRGSLDAWLKRNRPRREVVLATSQALTPERQHKLKDLARERGFTLVGLIEQSGVADRLRENGYWRERLLGLTGEPTTLSVVPASRRPLRDVEPIGRDGDIQWLKTTSGDRVLSGAPGSGKTFLLYHLTRQGWGIFVVDPEGPVAKDLRNQKPEVVIVDDAHIQPEFLVRLRHLRQELKLIFSIVATTWEWEKDKVIDALGVGEGQVHRLELLTRDEIVEVYRRLGVEESSDTMRYLVDQAANKPGLAATIGTLWLQGEWQDVIKGEALSRTLLTFFQRHVGPESTDILAAFGLGGDRGMEVEAVREFLGLSRVQIRQLAAGLAAGGVLSEVDRDLWAVWPRSLRSVLIRTVFFPPVGQPRYSYRDLVEKSPDLGRVAEELVEAKALGATIPTRELREIVAASGSPRAWNSLAQLSEQDAQWVLKSYPDVVEVGRSALLRAPESAIESLLKRVVATEGSTHSNPDHSMRILADWVKELDIPETEMISRRRLLARVSKKYIEIGGELSVGVHGICLALSPSVESGSLDPGAGRTFTISSGLLRVDQLRELGGVWKDAHDVLDVIDAPSWEHLSAMLWGWVYPEYSARSAEVSGEIVEIMHAVAARMLEDLAPLTQESPGLASGLQDFAKEIGLELPISQDLDFEKLYPSEADEEPGDWKKREEIQLAGINELVEKWVAGPPRETARKIAGYEKEAKRIHRMRPRLTPLLCRCVAKRVIEPEQWLDAFIEYKVPYDLVEPFLRETLDRQRDDAGQILDRYLRSDQYGWLAAEYVLQMSAPTIDLLTQVLDKVDCFPRFVETLCVRGQVSLPNLRALLGHPNWEVALTTAVGEWLCNPKGEVGPEIAGAWRTAILRAKPGEYSGTRYWLGEIFKADRGLAFDWLNVRLREDSADRIFLAKKGPFSTAVSVLNQEQRIRILGALGDQMIPQPLVSMLVDKDPVVYRMLLELEDLSSFHQEPLVGIPDKRWVELAMIALEVGYDPQWVAQAAFHPTGVSTFWGAESKHWGRWDEAFAQLEEGPREIQEVARHGRQVAQAWIQRAREEERQEEIHGL